MLSRVFNNPMKLLRLLVCLAVLPAGLAAAATLKVDRHRSFVNVDVKATVGSFTGRLEAYEARVTFEPAGRIRAATFRFRFADLKTGDAERDAEMLRWAGGPDAAGAFTLGALALTPDGQGHATGRLVMNGRPELIEFPVNVSQLDGVWTLEGAATLRYTDWGLKVVRRFVVVKVDPEVKVRFKLIGTPAEGK